MFKWPNRGNHHDDAALYEIAASELASGAPERGLLAKAYSSALGDEAKAKAIYIQFRVEQLKAQLVERMAVEKEREKWSSSGPRAGGAKGTRGAYLKSVAEAFALLRTANIPDMSDIQSARFIGSVDSLQNPVRASDVADALGLLEFKVIDAVKAGIVNGAQDREENWWVEMPSSDQKFRG